jgi:hypothetical protein
MSKSQRWEELGAVAPRALVEPRLELHWAAQVAAAAGTSMLEPRVDASHTNLGWDERVGALVTHPLGKLRAALRPADLALLLVDDAGNSEAELGLGGVTLDDAMAWLAGQLRAKLGRGEALLRPEHDMPSHRIADGAPFSATLAGLAELARWFVNADRALSELADAHPGASPVRCWPHHFDIATLITVEASDDPERARTVGVGMTPGDGAYAQPYWYVTPWPYPADLRADFGALAGGGRWHRDGWLGAVLVGSARETDVRGFLASAIALCRAIVGA